MNEYARPVTFCGLLQTGTILVGCIAARLGTNMWNKFFDDRYGNHLGLVARTGHFMTDYGFWLLLVPLAWSAVGMFVITRDEKGTAPRPVMGTGIMLTAVFMFIALMMLIRMVSM